jgi:hypothetical protein
MPSTRAAMFTPSPRISSPSMMMSPTLMPIRIWIGLASELLASCSRSCLWISMAQVTASTALANSTKAPSPMSLTIRPEWAAIVGSISSRRKALSRDSVPASSMPMRREYPTTSADRIAASLLCRRSSAMQNTLPKRADRHEFMAGCRVCLSRPPMSEMGQSLPNCDVRVASVHPSISDIMLQRRKRRNGPIAAIIPGFDGRDGRVARREQYFSHCRLDTTKLLKSRLAYGLVSNHPRAVKVFSTSSISGFLRPFLRRPSKSSRMTVSHDLSPCTFFSPRYLR